MANEIKIGGRLHSVASGNVLAGADEIIDDNTGKKQSVINAEVQASLATIPQTASAEITENDPTAAPEANAVIEDGEIKITLKNIKGETGEKMKFSDLSAEEKEALRGPRGESVIVNPGDVPMAHDLGGDSAKVMSQLGVTAVVDDLKGKLYNLSIERGAYLNGYGSVKYDSDAADWFVAEYHLDEPIADGDVIVWSGIVKDLSKFLQFFNGETFKYAMSASQNTSRSLTVDASDTNLKKPIGCNIIKASFPISKMYDAKITVNERDIPIVSTSKISALEAQSTELQERAAAVESAVETTKQELQDELYEIQGVEDGKYVRAWDGTLLDDADWYVEEYILESPLTEDDVIVWSGIIVNVERCIGFYLDETKKATFGANSNTRTISAAQSTTIVGSNIIRASYYKAKKAEAAVTRNGDKLELTKVSKIEQAAADSKFATGEKIKEVSITGSIAEGSTELPTSGAVHDVVQALDERIDAIGSLPGSDTINYNYGYLGYPYGRYQFGRNVATNDKYGYTDLIECSEGDIINFVYGVDNSKLNILFFDANGYFNRTNDNSTVESCSGYAKTVEVPSGVAYVSMSFLIGSGASVTINDKKVWEEKALSNLTASGHAILKLQDKSKSAAEYNKDKQSMITSLCRHRPEGSGKWPVKHFVIAQITDTHADNQLVKRAVEFLNSEEFDDIDCLINTGDIQHYQFTPDPTNTDKKKRIEDQYAVEFNKVMNIPFAKKAFTCLGNHDVHKSTSREEVYNRFMKPMVDCGALSLISNTKPDNNIKQNETWYFVDFATYKVRLIVLNDFDPLYDGVHNEALYVTRYSPAQIQFLIAKLQSVPEDYTVIVADHFLPTRGETYQGSIIDSEWNSKAAGTAVASTQQSLFTGDVNPVVDILAAYKAKGALSKTYDYSDANVQQALGSITVDVDFSSAEGTFGFVLNGHAHIDQIYTFPDHEDIMVSGCDGGISATLSDSRSCIYRNEVGKSQDAINVYCLREDLGKVFIIRIGADYRDDGVEHKVTSFTYKETE